MTDRWHYRKAHTRRLTKGRTVSVRGGWVLRDENGHEKGAAFRWACPICGAPIVSVRMPKGGWVHFEGGQGLTRIKHPCLHLGEGLSRQGTKTPPIFSRSPVGSMREAFRCEGGRVDVVAWNLLVPSLRVS